MISIIVATAKNNVIGASNGLPWHLPADLQHFKSLTLGHTVIMGHNTLASILSSLSHPLLGRQNIVLSSSTISTPGVIVVGCLTDALAHTKNEEVFVIGGASVYKQFLPMADKIYITEIDADIEGDVFFPNFDRNLWQEQSRVFHERDSKNVYDLSFVTLLRKK